MNGFIKTPQGLTATINGKVYTATKDHRSYSNILKLLNSDQIEWDKLPPLFDIAKAVVKETKGKLTVEKDCIRYEGEIIHNVMVERVLEFMDEGAPFKPLLNFLERCMANPSKRSIEELYTFLEHKKLPITEDGYFLAYKAVRSDWKDKHTGTIDNHIGQKPFMPRRNVNDDFRVGCSYGYHVGTLEYVQSFGNKNAGDIFLICKVDPANVVSVPEDCNCQKVRCCEYEVVGLYEGPLPQILKYERDEEDDWSYDEDEDYNDDFWYEEDEEELCDCDQCRFDRGEIEEDPNFNEWNENVANEWYDEDEVLDEELTSESLENLSPEEQARKILEADIVWEEVKGN